MIVVSLLLILVAVTLLVLGLTGGSSALLISSIVASLLAAVFLVIGARQAAAVRRAAPTAPPLAEDDTDENAVYVAEPEFAAAAHEMAGRRTAGDYGDDQRETVQFDPADVAAAKPSAGPDFSAARTEFVEQPGFAAERSERPAGDLSADETRVAEDPDYDRASAAINSARSSASDDAFRDASDGRGDAPREASGGRDDDFRDRDTAQDVPGGRDAVGGHDDVAEAEDECDEPAADDPDDEPLPQAVQPADAVRVARLDAEVLVVDGRPRYHVPECPSLVGRLTEPIPVREAVELGFSPCGLCRPVDRLVGAAARS
jgi:hypothetical protein